MTYYILSLARSADVLVWWKPGEHGYTTDLAHAGEFQFGLIASDPGRYNNNVSTLAIPVTEARALAEYRVAPVHLGRLRHLFGKVAA